MSTKLSQLCLLLLFPIGADAAPWADDFQQLRRDYQVLAKDYQAVLSRVYGNQAAYGALNQKILTDLVKDFLGDLKKDAPYEKPPDGLIATAKKYADYALNLRDELKVLLDNADLRDSLTELDLRAQNLSFRGRALERMNNQPPTDTPVPPYRPPPPPPPPSRPTDFSALDDANLVNRWRDLGNRAFSNKAAEDAFYQRHPEYLKYRKFAELRSPADDVDSDLARARQDAAKQASVSAWEAMRACQQKYFSCLNSCESIQKMHDYMVCDNRCNSLECLKSKVQK